MHCIESLSDILVMVHFVRSGPYYALLVGSCQDRIMDFLNPFYIEIKGEIEIKSVVRGKLIWKGRNGMYIFLEESK